MAYQETRMRRLYSCCSGRLRAWLIVVSAVSLCACGGSGGRSTSAGPTISFSSSSSQVVITSRSSLSRSSLSSDNPNAVLVSGIITYDYVPPNSNFIGLNYSAVEKKPVRGALVELLEQDGSVFASGVTNKEGQYQLLALKNTSLKVRVKAQLLQQGSPSWNFSVTDNTNNNALYVLDGSYASTGTGNSTRNLHAPSGWTGSEYTIARSAAPFAILDSIYTGIERINLAGNTFDLFPLEFRWSTKNNTADGDLTRGEIGTSFFSGSEIYVLGDANNDSDEYDQHVLLHEWGHYLESAIFRSDSFGGNHADGEKLDMRLAMSEGFATAFASMILNNPNYVDTSGPSQAAGFSSDTSKRNRATKGYYSEGSIGSIFYNFYTSANNKLPNDLSSIFSVLSRSSYTKNEAMMSIYVFYDQYKTLFSTQYFELESLMTEQAIFGRNEYGVDETNNGGLAVSLPIYKSISPGNSVVNVCSSPEWGKFNKLSNSQLLKLVIMQGGSYNLSANKKGGADAKSKPELIVFNRGLSVGYAENILQDSVSLNLNLVAGTYILEVYDQTNRDGSNTDPNTLCFNVQVKAN
jgi:hypothetical protein